MLACSDPSNLFNKSVLTTIIYPTRNNITSTVVYDDPELGVVIQHNPRGRPSTKTQHMADETMRTKINELRNDLSIDNKTKMVLLLSFATDEMIKEVQKNPETWFMDVTSRANIQKRDLFILVVRKPDGTTIIGNVTLIPSGK